MTGTFQVKLPVGDDKQLLLSEENTLAILKWRLEQYSPVYRWRPVLQRYIDYVAGRVRGFGIAVHAPLHEPHRPTTIRLLRAPRPHTR